MKSNVPVSRCLWEAFQRAAAYARKVRDRTLADRGASNESEGAHHINESIRYLNEDRVPRNQAAWDELPQARSSRFRRVSWKVVDPYHRFEIAAHLRSVVKPDTVAVIEVELDAFARQIEDFVTADGEG